MYQILFTYASYAECKTIEEAVSLALAVHQSSNVHHTVEVRDPDDVVVLVLHKS